MVQSSRVLASPRAASGPKAKKTLLMSRVCILIFCVEVQEGLMDSRRFGKTILN
jgi:hypothetical protein